VTLADVDLSSKGGHESEEAAAGEMEQYRRRLADLQEMPYVERRRSLLICLQGLDTAAGKHGTIKHFLSAMSPQGCTVTHFDRPSVEEAALVRRLGGAFGQRSSSAMRSVSAAGLRWCTGSFAGIARGDSTS